jgi:hypothetical protein
MLVEAIESAYDLKHFNITPHHKRPVVGKGALTILSLWYIVRLVCMELLFIPGNLVLLLAC